MPKISETTKRTQTGAILSGLAKRFKPWQREEVKGVVEKRGG
jgi:hypothetical protein